jgi:hypothetical protein
MESGMLRYCSFAAVVAVMVAVVSCHDRHSSEPAAAINTAFSATTLPTTQTAHQLGFTFAPAPGRGKRSEGEMRRMNIGCVSCHDSDAHTMHVDRSSLSMLACVDCHGGKSDAVAVAPALIATFDGAGVPVNKQSEAYDEVRAAQRKAYEQLRSRDPGKYNATKVAAHVKPRHPERWKSAPANPSVVSGGDRVMDGALLGAAWVEELPDFIRFVNPGDLRAAQVTCASCHAEQTRHSNTSMMAHGAMLWGAAFYNNGSYNSKRSLFGEGYAPDGSPAVIRPTSRPTTRQVERYGFLVELWPLPRWEITQPGNVLRVFERGGKSRPVLGVPNPLDDAGRPDVKLSVRGFGTDVRTDPVSIGLQKTRLLDPTLNFPGTNDHPGDYRASGCSACHVVYANDRSPVHSGVWHRFGNQGRTASRDPAVNPATRPSSPAEASGPQPIQHQFVKQMPTSTCIVCHIHPGTNVLNSYLGLMWWDNETDAEAMYPSKQRNPSADDEYRASLHNPEASAARGKWSDPEFLQQLGTDEFNRKLKRTQFADFHGHGWVFRKVFRQDRKGNLLDAAGKQVAPDDPERFNKAVHLKDIHLERGMHCVDCHFSQDNHGDGNLYGETRNAVMVECIDCHGDFQREAAVARFKRPGVAADERQRLLEVLFTGPAARNTSDLQAVAARNQVIADRFELRGGRLWQRSELYREQNTLAFRENRGEQFRKEATQVGLREGWFVPQTVTIAPGVDFKARPGDPVTLGAYAHTIRKDNKTWGYPLPEEKENNPDLQLAHSSTKMSCYACHTSWNTSCFGCHLPQRANQRKPMLHNEGLTTRNYTSYNYQTLRDDVYMLGVDSSVKGNKVVPIRSACAVLVSSQDANRQWLYTQQQTISAEGFAGTAFSPYFPHTVRARETKQCSDCHVSREDDNNAVMAQLLLQGTNAVNFIGRFAWVACEKGGLEAVAVTEQTEPQAVIGSNLHKWAYPDFYKRHVDGGGKLAEHHHHDGTVLDVQLRGEYLYAACGSDGFIAYDVANIDNKGFSERIITAPVSPLGQRLYVKSKYATSICSPSTLAIDPTRPRDSANQEQGIHPLYAFLYLTDAQEGLIVIGNPLGEKRNRPGVATLLDGDPDNNFLKRALTFNPSGLLKGARHMALHGHHAYVSCDAGVVVLDLDNPLAPKHVTTLTNFSRPRKVAFQFRYAFVLDERGLNVMDVTDASQPRSTGASPVIPLVDARDIYISRAYAYVAAGKDGLAVIEIERPKEPKLVENYTADGKLTDATAVRIGMTNASLFAYVANGRNGLAVLQLTSPDDNPSYGGFSPKPQPRLIATHKTRGRAVSISEGLDRDRAVDEAGNQLAVFGRLGSRPFNREEQRRLYLRNGQLYTVSDMPATEPLRPAGVAPPATQPEAPRRGLPPRRPGAAAPPPATAPATAPATQPQPARRGIPPRR